MTNPDGRFGRTFPYVLLAVTSVLIVVVTVMRFLPLSAYDEYVYLDYLDKVGSQGVLRQGDETGELARNEISCRGVIGYGSFGEGCDIGGHDADEKYPYSGLSGADIYTPVYFALTRVLATPMTWAGVGLLDAGRYVGAFWLALGVCLTYLLLRRLAVRRWIALGFGMLIIATPAAYWASAFVSTDAPTLAVAATLGLIGTAVARRKRSPWWFVAASAIAIAFKFQNFGAVGTVAAAVLIWWWIDRKRTEFPRARAIIVGTALAAAVVAQLGWMVARASLADGSRTASLESGQPLGFGALLGESTKFLFSIGSTGLPVSLAATAAAAVLACLGIAGMIGLMVTGAARPQWQVAIAAVTLAVTLCYGPVLAVATRFAAGYYVALPPRYGLVLLPFIVVCAALFLQTTKRLDHAFPIVAVVLTTVAIVTV